MKPSNIRLAGRILLPAFFLWAFNPAWAQQDMKITSSDAQMLRYLQQNRFDIDTAAEAVILYEKGYVIIDQGQTIMKTERIIKILSKEATDVLGTVNLARNKDMQITAISAEAYNLEGQEIVKQSVARADILKDKIEKGLTVSKFNLPSLKAGTIIHYGYTTTTSGYHIPDWVFQNDYPTLYSEYEINVPNYVVYTASLRVNELPVEVKRRKELADCNSCTFTEIMGDRRATFGTWIRRNIPAFKEEPFMSSGDNYRERVKINVTGIEDNGIVHNIYKNWDDYSHKFYYKDNDFCGQAFNNNNFLNDPVAKLTEGKTTELEKAKAIFTFVRGNITKQSTATEKKIDIRDVLTERKGSLAGINLLLTAMLRKAGLNSAPVLLATKDNERLNKFYPDPQNINYLACKAEADGKSYFLDASAAFMPFGILPSRCYNGYSRVITEQGDFAILNPDSLKNRTTVIAGLEPAAEPGKLQLLCDYQFGIVSGINYRKRLFEDSTGLKADLLAQLKAANPLISQASCSFLNAGQPDEQLKLRYNATMDISGDAGMIYFNPYIDCFFEKNPFRATSRTYPVEMDYLSDMYYILNFSLPENYVIDDYPKSAVIKLGSSEVAVMKNLLEYDEAGRKFNINSRLSTQTTFFSSQAYNDLRTFFDHVIEEQHKKIVLKKLR